MEAEIVNPTGANHMVIQPVASRYTDCAIPVNLPSGLNDIYI
jgi:hypothetical protein